MQATRMGAPEKDRADIYNSQIKAVAELRSSLLEAAQASGQYHTQTVQTISASERLTKEVRAQKVGWGEARKALRDYRAEQRTGMGSALGEAIREQTALRQSMAAQFTGNVFGKNKTDLFIPKNLGTELDNARVKYGMINQLLASAAHQTVNWGKNTQWAGRQILVGLTVPLGMAAVGAGAIALKLDQELTRVAKVYDTMATTAAGKEAELAQVREVGLSQAKRLAVEYGMAMEDIVNIQAQLAATGLSGNRLFQSSAEAARIATLGEMDVQESIDMTVALQTAFRDTIKTSEDLTKAFNFFNSVENATSLAIQDIAEATPRAASAMAALGVSAQEMTVMLVAMKESGVDAAEAANALKSGATRILDPTPEAVEYWDKVLNMDLKAITDEAEGNMFEFMKKVSVALNGLDAQQVQTAISKTFGTYQFNRITALIGNMGDAITSGVGQTAKAFELLETSAADHAAGAANELDKLQQSISHKFKAAIEGVKAELVPLGEIALQIGTIVLNGLSGIIGAFNGLPDWMKTTSLILVGLLAVVGPLLMITGIFANLFGSMAKFFLGIGNMRTKFKALSVEEATAAINARNASSAFNTEASAAANLANQINMLTLAMERNAVASGALKMTSGGQFITGGNSRNVEQIGNSGILRYGAGSRDATGRDISNSPVSNEDREIYRSMQQSSAEVATNAANTSRSLITAQGAMTGIAAAAGIFAVMNVGASEGMNNWINGVAIAAGILATFPSILTGVFGIVGRIGRGIFGWGRALRGAGAGGVLSTITGIFGAARGAGGPVAGIKAMGTHISSLAPSLGRFAGIALRVFGPIGILAAGAIIVKNIYDDMTAMERTASALASSGQAWADAVGFDYNPGQIPGVENTDSTARAINLAKEMAEANEGLSEAFVNASDSADVYQMAVSQALRALSAGATVDQAREVFEASIRMSTLDEVQLEQLKIRFNSVDLSNPEAIQQELTDQIQEIFNNARDGMDLQPADDTNDSVVSTIGSWFRESFGGDLSDEGRAFGVELGSALGTAINGAAGNIDLQRDAFDQTVQEANEIFSSAFSELAADDEVKAVFDRLGITTADEFSRMWNNVVDKWENGEELTRAEQALWDLGMDRDNFRHFTDFSDAYSEFIDTFLQGLIDADIISEAQAEDIRANIDSLAEFTENRLGRDTTFNLGIDEAMDAYAEAINNAQRSGRQLNDEEKLAILNQYRLAASLEEATHWTQGFGNASGFLSSMLGSVQSSVTNLQNAMSGMMQVTPDDLVGSQRDAMGGAWNDILGEAERRFDEAREAQLDGIRDAGEARQKGFEAEAKSQDRHFDNLEKNLDAHWDRVEKEAEASWDRQMESAEDFWDGQVDAAEDAADADDKWFDNRIEGLEDERRAVSDSYDARIEAIRDTIDAEQEAEEKRQAIFEAEQRRIERMAERLNTNIDFNVALNSGELDEAAKIANDASARESNWSIDDSNETITSTIEARHAEMEDKIELLEKEKEARDRALEEEIERVRKEQEARREWHQERLEQIREAREAAIEALRKQQEADRENLRINRESDQERLRSTRETAQEELNNRRDRDREATDSAIQRAQRTTEADKRSLADRLRALQEFVPQNEQELNEHVREVERIYQQYGIDLRRHGGDWAGTIGRLLESNVSAAAAALQTSINWRMIAQNIASQIGEGMGMTMDQVREFLRTGVFPAGTAVPAPQYRPSGNVVADRELSQFRVRTGRHSGGPIPFTGGQGMSQADRVGVPRSASPYPSEVPLLAKAGEYVVNAKSARKNRGLLEAINNGDGRRHPMPRHAGGDVHSEDIGGPIGSPLMEFALGSATMGLMAMAKVAQVAAMAKIQQGANSYWEQLSAAEGGFSTGTIDGTGPIYQRMFATIKRAFPRASLNSGMRPGDPGYHGRGMAVDLGEQGFAGGAGRPYLAAMNRWIYDNFGGSTELIYNGIGDDRPNLWHGRQHAYSAATQAQHRNHVHWAMSPEAIAAAGRAGLMATGGGANYAPGSVRQQVQAAANQRGWGSGAQWAAIDWVISRESSWNPGAQNPVSSASGLFQHIDATWRGYRSPAAARYAKMRLAPVPEQAYAGMNYFGQRYGSPVQARAFWERNHWYDEGGFLPPGRTMAMNGTGRPEPVFTGPQWDVLKANIGNTTYDLPGRDGLPTPVRIVDSNVATGTQTVYDIDIDLRGAYIKEEIDIQDAVERAIEKRESRNGRKRVIA